jgi:hypothetical protein
LSDLNVSKGCQLQCEDFDQPVEFQLFILHDDSFGADNFKIVMDSGNLTKNGNGHVKGDNFSYSTPMASEVTHLIIK